MDNNNNKRLNNKPLQAIHSFEGLINGTDGIEVLISSGRPKPLGTVPDITNFEERVRKELKSLKDRGIGGIVTNVGYKNYLVGAEKSDKHLRCKRL